MIRLKTALPPHQRFWCRGLLLAILIIPLALVSFQQKWDVLEGEHYDIKYTTSSGQARELLEFMDEYIFPNYKFMLNLPNWEGEKKFTIRLYNNKGEYLQDNSEVPKTAGAHYNPANKELVGFFDNADKMQALFAHEGMHQFTDMAIPNFERMPIWYIEGMADCIGNCKIDGDKLYVCVKDGWTAKQRLPKLVKMFKKNAYIKLKNMLYYTKDMFYKEAEMAYPEAWGFCHFLLNAPHKGMDDERKIKGKYKTVIVDFHNLMANNKDIKLEEAYKKTFVYEDKPIDIDQLEKKFKEYILQISED